MHNTIHCTLTLFLVYFALYIAIKEPLPITIRLLSDQWCLKLKSLFIQHGGVLETDPVAIVTWWLVYKALSELKYTISYGKVFSNTHVMYLVFINTYKAKDIQAIIESHDPSTCLNTIRW